MVRKDLDSIIREIEGIIGPCCYEDNLSEDDVIESVPCDYAEIGIEMATDFQFHFIRLF